YPYCLILDDIRRVSIGASNYAYIASERIDEDSRGASLPAKHLQAENRSMGYAVSLTVNLAHERLHIDGWRSGAGAAAVDANNLDQSNRSYVAEELPQHELVEIGLRA